MQLDRLDEIDLAEIELKRKDDDVVTALIRRIRDLIDDIEQIDREPAGAICPECNEHWDEVE